MVPGSGIAAALFLNHLASGLCANASTTPNKRAVDPIVKGTPQVLGLVTDPRVNRDSCGSVRFQDRDLWTCRDTQVNDENGLPLLQITSSSASWTNFWPDGSPYVEPFLDGTLGLLMNGDHEGTYFPLQDGQCNDNSAGTCGDNTRYAIWPDSPPMVASGADGGAMVAYTWIANLRIRPDFSTDIPDPSVSLFRTTYDAATIEKTALPTVDLVDGGFWAQDQIAYGTYGNVVKDGVAYLYGKTSTGVVAVAMVPVDGIEDKSRYQYWVNGVWSLFPPLKDDSTANIVNAGAGGQGTFYYSDIWQSYVWIGQAAVSISADFFITTAPDPTGPWEEAEMFFSGENGSAKLSAYSLQAHPDMVPLFQNRIYLTYTKVDRLFGSEFDIYSTPLIMVEWEDTQVFTSQDAASHRHGQRGHQY